MAHGLITRPLNPDFWSPQNQPLAPVVINNSAPIRKDFLFWFPGDGLTTFRDLAGGKTARQVIDHADATLYNYERRAEGLYQKPSVDSAKGEGIEILGTDTLAWNVADGAVGWRVLCTASGSVSNFCVWGDEFNLHVGGTSYNRITIVSATTLEVRVGNRAKTHTIPDIQDGVAHSYVVRWWTVGGTRTSAVYRDGVNISEDTHEVTSHVREANFAIVCGGHSEGFHNRGINGLVSHAWLAFGPVSEADAIYESLNPFACVKPANDRVFLYSVAGGDINVSAGTTALTLTTYAATVDAATNVQAASTSLTLATYAATVDAETQVQAASASLALTTYAATVAASSNIQAASASLTITTYQASTGGDVNVESGTTVLAVTVYAASISLVGDTNVSAGLASLALTTYMASVVSGSMVLTSADLDAIAHAVWSRDRASYTDVATFGGWVNKKLLTVAKFLGLQ